MNLQERLIETAILLEEADGPKPLVETCVTDI